MTCRISKKSGKSLPKQDTTAKGLKKINLQNSLENLVKLAVTKIRV